MTRQRLPDANVCPYLAGACIGARCMMWRQFVGSNPQTGEPIDRGDCSIAMAPILQIEIAGEVRKVQSSAEQFRALGEQVVRSQALGRPTEELQRLLKLPTGMQLPGLDPAA